MSDVRPAKKRSTFVVPERDVLSNQKDHEISLIEALRLDEEQAVMKKEIQKKLERKEQLEIQAEARKIRAVSLDQYFAEEDIPLRVVSRGIHELGDRDQGIKEIKDEVVEMAEIEYQEQVDPERTFELDQIEKEKIIEEQKLKEERIKQKIQEEARLEADQVRLKKNLLIKKERAKRKSQRERRLNRIKKNLLTKPEISNEYFGFWKPALAFSSLCFVAFAAVFSFRFISYGMQIKDQVVVKGVSVAADLDVIKNNLKDKNFSQTVFELQNIQGEINDINKALEKMEGGLPEFISKIPFVSKYGSAKKVLEAGEEIAKAMILITQSVDEFSKIENPLDFEAGNKDDSLGEFFLGLEEKMIMAEDHLDLAQKKLNEVDPGDLPEEYQVKIELLQKTFPELLALLKEFNQKQVIFKDLLGYNGPRKYLFLFQNNHEIRATGGFIGSYGVLSVHNGNVKELFVDGIFNPDGQLSAKVVPPRPIQKISTNWSTHDANWYPDFPTSAEKIAWFYEKTGGPTVDGIITLTPTVMEKLLKITGPIEMIEYDVTVDADNFIEATQFEVEEDYDKEENRPKKFIADLTPKILDKVFSREGLGNLTSSLSVFSESLKEKHILIHSENSEIQSQVSELGWSGEVLEAPEDYLMVVNSNVNGYKTDGVIDQNITHQVEIEADGSVFNTVTIERVHNGGSSDYEWWNKVNSNYMRVYVPQGSELIEASGHTRETVNPPVNYDKLGFKRDDLVVSLESSADIHSESGTEVWDESGKTVFGNWVYVSPQEKVEVTYKYKLPFKLDIDSEEGTMDTYSILYQKQSGMNTSALKTEIEISDEQEVFWKYPDDFKDKDKVFSYNSNLEKDRFLGIVLQ